MNLRVYNSVKNRLSLRAPQAESLEKLAKALDIAPQMRSHKRDVKQVLELLKEEFPTLESFERDFPSLCFALATGVGKTRLMGAFISYLYLAYGIRNFFVLAPNLTIYEKLINDFTPNTPKYVFQGIEAFAINPPDIITGDNYAEKGSSRSLFGDVRINIFNISKINAEVRGGKTPKIKRLSEYIGDSYFNYLSELDDLVLLMDESHRYRASAGVRAINELNPLFGLELTATPFVESNKGPIPFKNVVMDYPLAKAMEDGFVKEPAVVTQRDFDAKLYTPQEIEKIKLEDAIRLHENTKVELITYARQNELKRVKPFVLVIARDTTHASSLLELIKSDAFFEGRYKDKVIQVDSSTKGKKEDDMIERLLMVEHEDEPTEIVIHVNMLKEGWDVTNLYTIVPLRAANARTLIEQSIGRGLRLPYGKRTGVASVDRLSIVAHDKFQEIVDEANRGDSPLKLKQVILEPEDKDKGLVSVTVSSGIEDKLGIAEPIIVYGNGEETEIKTEDTKEPLFSNESQKEIAKTTMEVIKELERDKELVPTTNALKTKKVQEKIAKEVEARLTPKQQSLFKDDEVSIEEIVSKTATVVADNMIDIPRITIIPKGEVTTGYEPFKLDMSGLNLQPAQKEIVIQSLETNEQETLNAQVGIVERRLEDYIVFSLIDYEDIDYMTQADLLYDLASQAVEHFRSYLSDDETRVVLDHNRRLIADNIHAQMIEHFWEKATEYEVKISRGFTSLKPSVYTASKTNTITHYRTTVEEKSKIKTMLFGGFKKCLYPLQKFDSDTERRFAVILERDSQKWFKPIKGQFQIYYKYKGEQPEYVPDFVVETPNAIYMIEIKSKKDMQDDVVLAKANAAKEWCKHTSEYAVKNGLKPWKYLLIPHDEVDESKKFGGFERFSRI